VGLEVRYEMDVKWVHHETRVLASKSKERDQVRWKLSGFVPYTEKTTTNNLAGFYLCTKYPKMYITPPSYFR
jgi:hypothetical protein